MMTMIVRSDLRKLDLLEKVVEHNVGTSARAVTNRLAELIHQNWSEASPSSPYETPAIVTGRLDGSVEVEDQGRSITGQFAGKDGPVYVLRVTAEHARPLEYGTVNMLPRPFIRPAVEQVADELPDFYKDAIGLKIK